MSDGVSDEAAPPRRRRVWWWAAGAVVAVGLVVAGLAATGSHTSGDAKGFSLPPVDGDGMVTLASFRGKPVVVNFFASWCVPCRKEMPAIQATAAKLGEKVAFVGIDHQDDRGGALQLLNDSGVRYPTGYDPAGQVATSYGLFGMPTTLFVDRDGRLVDKHTGEITQEKLEQDIQRLFGVTA